LGVRYVDWLAGSEDETSNHSNVDIKPPLFFESPIIVYVLTHSLPAI